MIRIAFVSQQQPVQSAITAWTLLMWLPRFLKYELVPIQLRYVVWFLLQPWRGVGKQLRKQLVLRGEPLECLRK